MKPAAVSQAEAVLGARATSWTRVESRGYSIAAHWIVALADGATAFVKRAVDGQIAARLRAELPVYENVRARFLPRYLGWAEGELPALVLEDLSPGSTWPPPWTPEAIEAVLAALEEIARTPAPPALPRLDEDEIVGWNAVAADPEPFLRLRIFSPGWLAEALPALVAAEAATPWGGDALVHCDVRSDNLCIRDGRAVLFDWNLAEVGNPAFDVAFWLPSLALEEGGPPVAEMARRVPGTEEFAAAVAGFFAARAGLPPPTGAPAVRGFQLAQLEVALPWAASVLDLPPR